MVKTALICGVSGQDGAYLASLLLSKGYEVHGTTRDVEISLFRNLRTLNIFEKVQLHSMAINDFRSVLQVISKVLPDEIYNLAGQSSVGLSFEQPVETMESIILGTLNLLESIRFLKKEIRFYNAGSGECFGDTPFEGANETTSFHPRSPYAVAKSAAFWEVANYRDAYHLYACSGILFNHESPLRPQRFVTQKIIRNACRIAKGEIDSFSLGNLQIQRDWGWSPEFVEAMWLMLQQPEPEDFVIATGSPYSLENFLERTFSAFNLDWNQYVSIDANIFRPSDINYSKGDPARANQKLGWKAQLTMPDIIKLMVTTCYTGKMVK